MGLLDTINTSDGRQNNNNFLPSGQHELEVTGVEVKDGTNKNVGKKWVILKFKIRKSSRADLATCSPGMPTSIFVECNQYPDWAGQRLKNFMLATATEDEVAGYPRGNLKPHQIQQSTPQAPNPYDGQPNGITWGEYFNLVADPEVQGAMGSVVQCVALDSTSKKGNPVTNYDFVKKGAKGLTITPIATPQPTPAAAAAPAVETPAATPTQKTGSIFG